MKLKNLPIQISLLCSLLLLAAFIPKADDPIDKIVASLQKWTDSNPQEKVYLHMDKPYYALGDTIWFKGYITIGTRHQLSALSKAIYVDLITERDSVVKSLKLPITSGMVIGDFTLGDDLKEGSYRIRAYTQWMRNAGPDYFFDKTFTVGSLVSDNVIVKADYHYITVNKEQVLSAVLNYAGDNGQPLAEKEVEYQIVIDKKVVGIKSAKTDAMGNLPINISNEKHVDLSGAYIRTVIEGSDKQKIVRNFPIKAVLLPSDVQFFPESGNLVNGLSSRVAFKAIGVDGAGTAIKGTIIDNANTEITEIETLHAGMGSFLLRPEAGKTYTAKVTFADGSTKNIALPKAIDEGYVLGVYQPNKDSILVRINASASLVAQQATINLIAQTNGEVIIASPVKIVRPTTSVWLEKKTFPTGIAQFTLFNATGEPLNERIAFIRSIDLMQVNIKTPKASYSSKEPIEIGFDVKDSKGQGVAGNFSATVIDESKVPFDETLESTIFTNILLTSDIKGYIEKPNYYFINETEEVDKALDDLMLTQGYRRFVWKELAAPTTAKNVFEAEPIGAVISGTVQTLGQKPLPNANVTLFSLRQNYIKTTTADASGHFKFDGIILKDSVKFAVQARSAKNSDKVIVVLDTLPRIRLNKNPNFADVTTNITNTLKAYIDNGKKLDDFYEKTGQLDKVQRLKEVRIKARRAKADPTISPQGMFRIPEGSADRTITFSETDVASCTNLSMCLQSRLPGIVITSEQGVSVIKDLRNASTSTTSTADDPTKKPIMLIIDGRRVQDANEISDILEGGITPEDVAKIDLVRTNLAMISSLGGPAILIYTKLGYTRKSYNPSIVNISPKGFNKARVFYSPKYSRPGNADNLADLRTTVYWDPYLKSDATGKGTFTFYNADGPGAYKVVVEGINAAGELGRQVYRYTVTK